MREPACGLQNLKGASSPWSSSRLEIDVWPCWLLPRGGVYSSLTCIPQYSPFGLGFVRGSPVASPSLASLGVLSCLSILCCPQRSRSPGFRSHPKPWPFFSFQGFLCHITLGSAYSLPPFQWCSYENFLFIHHCSYLLNEMLRDLNFLNEGLTQLQGRMRKRLVSSYLLYSHQHHSSNVGFPAVAVSPILTKPVWSCQHQWSSAPFWEVWVSVSVLVTPASSLLFPWPCDVCFCPC